MNGPPCKKPLTGNFVILTFEGEKPAEELGKIMAVADEEFAAFARRLTDATLWPLSVRVSPRGTGQRSCL